MGIIGDHEAEHERTFKEMEGAKHRYGAMESQNEYLQRRLDKAGYLHGERQKQIDDLSSQRGTKNCSVNLWLLERRAKLPLTMRHANETQSNKPLHRSGKKPPTTSADFRR